MCLRAQGIDGVVKRILQDRRLRDDDGGVGRGRGIDDGSKRLETTTEASRIQGQQLMLWRRDHRPD